MKLFSSVLPYLLLVSFYSGQISDFRIDKIKTINESPYHGAAVQLIGAYDTGKYTWRDFENAVRLFKKESKKHIWPWVFFNRFIGYSEEGKSHSPLAQTQYFKDIKGMDIYNEKGALMDFYNIWQLSLRIARYIDAPGIVIDIEAYNNYKNYQLSYLSQQLNRPEEEVKERLKAIGAELADIAEKEYPQATLWFTFTGLANPYRNLNPFNKEYRTVTYIVQGMLDRVKEKNSKLKFVTGGMLSLGYCYESLEDLKETVRKRNESFIPVLSAYPNLLLGGTIAPWNDIRLKKEGYFTNGKCGENDIKNMQEFKPLISQLLTMYDYIWIYAAGAVEFNPYNSKIYPAYNKALEESLLGTR